MDIVDAAKKWALDEIEKYGPPYFEPLEIAEQKALELCDKLKLDKTAILLGVYLMDIKLGQCVKDGVMEKHVERGIEAAKDFLNNFSVDTKLKEKVLNCIAAHHGAIPFSSLESEVCANADCYKFLTPRGIFFFLTAWGARGESFSNSIKMLESKLEEKYKILTLETCKQELEPYYKIFKRYISEAR